MPSEKVELVIDAKADAAIREMQRLNAASTRTADQLHKVETSAKKAGEGSRSLSDNLQILNKANSATAGSFGAITGPLDDFGDLIEKVGAKNAALIAGVGGLAAAFIAVGVNAVDVASNFKAYEEQLGSTNETILRNRDAMMDASDAMDGAWRSMTELRIELAGHTSGALYNVSILAMALGDAFKYMLSGGQGEGGPSLFDRAKDSVDGWIDALKTSSIPAINAMGQALGFVDDRLTQVFNSEIEKAKFEAENARVMAKADEVSKQVTANIVQMEKEKTKVTHTSAGATRDAAAASRERQRELDAENKKLEEQIAKDAEKAAKEMEQMAALAAFYRQTQEEQDKQTGVQTFHDTIGLDFQPSQVAYDPMNDVVDQTKKTAAEWSSTWQNEIQAVGGYLGGFADLAAQIGSRVIAQTEEDTKKAKKKQFAIEKASAIAQATINTFLGISAALTTPGPAGVVLAVLAGITGAAQVALIAATPPPAYHIGGLLPDEVNQGSYKSRENERTAVFTQQAIRNMGGEDTIKRLNAGDKPSQVNNYFVIDGQPRLARAFAGPTPDYGIRNRR